MSNKDKIWTDVEIKQKLNIITRDIVNIIYCIQYKWKCCSVFMYKYMIIYHPVR